MDISPTTCRTLDLSAEGIRSIGRAVEVMAAAEHLDAHRNAMSVRMAKLNSTH